MKNLFPKIPNSKPYLNKEMEEAVMSALKSGKYILGENCSKFEEEFSHFIGTDFGVLTNSATSAILLTLISLGIEKDDEIIVPSLTAFPTIEPILFLGAKPVFVDIGNDYLIDCSLIEEKITPKTKIIMPVHLYGNVCDMDKILEISKKHNLIVIEDCSQAHGSEYKDKKAGSFGKASIFSFYPSKNMTFFGDGGIVLTNSSLINEKVRMLRNHGRKDKNLNCLVGFNMRCNEIQASAGLIQLKNLKWFIERRRKIAMLYNDLLKDLPIIIPASNPEVKHAYHLYVIQVKNRKKVVQMLEKNGIQIGIHYPRPCHLQPIVVERIGMSNLPKTEEVCDNIISLPIYPELKEEKIKYIVKQLESSVERFK